MSSASSSSFQVGTRVVLNNIDKNSTISVAATLASPSSCRVCGEPSPHKCAACKQAGYCSREHQAQDWKNHKPICKQTKIERDMWDGQHGVVAAILTGEVASETRLIVNLDLLPFGDFSRVSVAPAHVSKEPAILVAAQAARADVANGSLVEGEGRALCMVLDFMRLVVANIFLSDNRYQTVDDIHELRASQTGLAAIMRMTSTAWTMWTDGTGYPASDGKGVYEHLYKMVKDDLPGLNPGMVNDPSFKKMLQSMDDQAAVKGWNVRVHGDFWVVGMDDDGTLLIPAANRDMVYKCVGMRDAIWPKIQSMKPGGFVQMTVTMIPWYGRLIYDGTLVPAAAAMGTMVGGFNEPTPASPALEAELKASVEKAKKEGRVISRLAQLEVDNGSTMGLHDRVKKDEAATAAATAQGPATETEQALLDKLVAIPKTPGATANTTGNGPLSDNYWVFRRMGYSEAENPEHRGIILANASPAGYFECSALAPTAADILKALARTSRQMGKRPSHIGIDDKGCFERVMRLLESVDGTTAFYYAPPTPAETAAHVAAGNMGY